jgi:hypothetical protein
MIIADFGLRIKEQWPLDRYGTIIYAEEVLAESETRDSARYFPFLALPWDSSFQCLLNPYFHIQINGSSPQGLPVRERLLISPTRFPISPATDTSSNR